MKLYHYSSKPFNTLWTLNKQVNMGLNVGKTKAELDATDAFNIKVQGTPPYSQHISLHIDPLNIQFLEENFPKDSPYFRNGHTLYEHIIDINDIVEPFKFRLVETPLDNIMNEWLIPDILWNVDAYQRLFYMARALFKNAQGTQGTNRNALIKAITPFQGKILGYFINWVNSEEFKTQGSRMYKACN